MTFWLDVLMIGKRTLTKGGRVVISNGAVALIVMAIPVVEIGFSWYMHHRGFLKAVAERTAELWSNHIKALRVLKRARWRSEKVVAVHIIARQMNLPDAAPVEMVITRLCQDINSKAYASIMKFIAGVEGSSNELLLEKVEVITTNYTDHYGAVTQMFLRNTMPAAACAQGRLRFLPSLPDAELLNLMPQVLRHRMSCALRTQTAQGAITVALPQEDSVAEVFTSRCDIRAVRGITVTSLGSADSPDVPGSRLRRRIGHAA